MINSSSDGTQKQKVNQNIQVYVRVRPTNNREKLIRSNEIIEVSGARDIIAKQMLESRSTKKYTFDRAFGMDSQQHEVYASVVSPMIDEVLAGYNCTVFAYGQTGTGKTYTMVGEEQPTLTLTQEDNSNVGIIPRALNHLFDELRLMECEFAMRVSYLELYNEELCDLLSSDDTAKIRIFDDVAKKGSVIVQGLEEIPVKCKSDVYRLLAKGQERRRTAATLMNAQSSRSHTIFTILVHIKENNVEGEEMLKIGKLNLVDLAGSENISKAGNEKGIRTRESVNINQSLLTLGRVITALVERTPHIPYRESKLTRLLQESLGGRTKTSIIATVSPGHKDLEETLSTLDYAHRAKNIQNKPEINQRLTKKVVLKEYTEEIDRLKRDLMAAREKNGIYLASDTYNDMIYKMEKDQKEMNENIQRCRALKEELCEKTKLFEECSQNLEFVSDELGKEKFKNQITESELSKTKRNLRRTERQNQEKIQIIKSQQNTEKNLTEHAQELLGVVDEAAGDTRSLLESIDRRKNVEQIAATANDLLLKTLSDNLALMRRQVEEMKMKHQESVKIVVADLDENSKYSKKFVSAVDEALKELKNLQKENGNEMMKIFTDFKCEMKENSTESCENLTELQRNIEEQLMKFSTEINGKIGKIENVLGNDKKENEKIHENLSGKIEMQGKIIENFCNDLKVKLVKISADYSKISTSLKTKTQLQSKKIEEVMKLMKEINEINDECNILSNDMENIDNDLKSIESENVEIFIKENSKISDEKSKYMKTLQELHQKTYEEINENLANSTEITKSFDSAMKSSLNNQKTLISLSLEKTSKSLENTENSINDQVKKSSENQEMKLENLLETFKRENSRSNVKSQEVKSIVQQTLPEIVHKTDEQIEISYKNCSESIREFEEQDLLKYKSTGETPVRKDYRVNRNLIATSPHDRIVRRFRIESGMLDNSLDNSITEVQEEENVNESPTPNAVSSTPFKIYNSTVINENAEVGVRKFFNDFKSIDEDESKENQQQI